MKSIRIALAFATLAGGSLFADTKTYTWKGTGATDEANKWSVATNWEGDAAPSADETCAIVIPAVTHTRLENDITGLTLTSLAVSSADAFTLAGNAVSLAATATCTLSTDGFADEMPIAFPRGATNLLTVASGATSTFAAGTLTGEGGFKKTGDGTVVLAGDNTFEGNVVLYRGYIKMSTTRALGTAYKTIRIGPNHDSQSKNYTQLTLTKAMDFEYNLDFSKQTGPYYYSAEYLVCPANTRIKGTVRMTEAQSFIYLQASSGNLYLDNDVYLYYRCAANRHVYFNGRAHKVGTGSSELNYQGSGAAHLAVAGNEIDNYYLGYGGAEFDVPFALWSNCVIRSAYEYGTGEVKLNGHDQLLAGFTTTSSYFNKSECHHNVVTPSGKPCRLTVAPKANWTGRYHFNGPLTLAIDSPSGKTQAVVNAESTMTGSLIVSNGAFKIGYNCNFAYVPAFEIGAKGALIATNGVTVGTGDSTLALETGGRLVLENGATMSVKSVAIDGTVDKSLYGKDLCAVGAGVEGATEVSWMDGTGVLTVNPLVVEDDPHTWSGGAGAGAATESMANPLNWGMAAGDTPPALDGGLVATFAEAGTNAWFADDLALNQLIFNAPNDFNLTARDDGTVTIAAKGVSATGAHTYTIDAAASLGLGQTWSAAAGTTLVAARGLGSSGNYAWTASGGGTVVLSGDVTLSGNMDVSATKLILRDAELTETTGNLTLLDTAARLVLDNATVRKPIAVGVSSTSPALATAEGSTNVILSGVKWADTSLMRIGKDSQLTIEGNLTNLGYSPILGEGRDVSSLVITNGTLSGSYFSMDNVSIHLWSTGNLIADYWPVQSGATLYLHVADALNASTAFHVYGPIDLCGRSQKCGCLKASNANGVFTSDEPAVLTVYQANGANIKSIADAAKTYSGRFTGAAGLRKKTGATLTLSNENPTTGSLEAGESNLVLSATAYWNGTNVCVSADGAVLELNGNGNLNRKTILRVTAPGGRVSVAGGVTARVRWMYVPELSDPDPETGAVTTNSVRLAAGTYTSENCPYVTGEGAVRVDGRPGFVTILQ